MKKLAAIALVAITIGFLGSCKPKEKCPAYGKAKYHSLKRNS
ncbi:MAG: hypothetical protein ABI723_04125 [Bacteroidia bacterium]